jgi:hypothetical protein
VCDREVKEGVEEAALASSARSDLREFVWVYACLELERRRADDSVINNQALGIVAGGDGSRDAPSFRYCLDGNIGARG